MNDPLVQLVGAGPGHPGFLTLRAVECLAQADLVIYDKLVPLRTLEFASEQAERICVSDLVSYHGESSPRVHQRMIEAAKQGKRVVRLKGGDPFIFGRGGEEAEALLEAGIPFEIVPGITAGIGAAACAGIPLTHRAFVSGVCFITGHENPTKPASAIDWPLMARFPGTIVIYMAIAHLSRIVQLLVENGKDADTPAAAIHWATTGDQRTIEAPLHLLASAVQAAGLTAPAIVVIGSVVTLRSKLAWFEQRPLFNRRVLVTRPRHQSADFLRQLEHLGGVPYLLPAVEIREPSDWAPVDHALAQLGSFDWLVFTSANGVHSFLRRLRQTGRDLRALGSVRLASIGPMTAATLREYHLEPDLIPREFRSESLAEALKEALHVQGTGKRILLARADRGRDILRQELGELAEVVQVAVYAQRDAIDDTSEVFDCLRRGEIDYVTLTSSNIARALLNALDAPCRARIESGQVRIVSISPVTSATIREFGLPVAAEAVTYTSAGLLEALTKLARSEKDVSESTSRTHHS